MRILCYPLIAAWTCLDACVLVGLAQSVPAENSQVPAAASSLGQLSPVSTSSSNLATAPAAGAILQSSGDQQASSPAASAPSLQAQALTECEVIAKIDGQIVQACEVLWRVNQLLEENRDRIPPNEIDMARQFLMQREIASLVDTKLLYAEFQRNVPAENLDKIFDKLQEPFESEHVPGLLEQFQVADVNELELKLHAAGTSLRDMRQAYRERAIASQWLRSNIEFDEEVTHQEMLDYYHEHAADYDYPTQARWEELMVDKNRFNYPSQAYAALANMGNEAYLNAVAKQLRGPIFAEVAQQKSHGLTAQEGGERDWTTQGALKSQDLDRALFSLEVGQMSNIIETETGFHIVRVLERKEAGRTPFQEVQAEIVEAIKRKRFNEAVGTYLSELRRHARVWTVFTGDTSVEKLAQPPASATRR